MPGVTFKSADGDLIRRVAADHRRNISRTQLQRWRRLGLLPTVPVVHEQLGAIRMPLYGEDVVRAAGLLAESCRRGRPWELAAEELFNAGHPLQEGALRRTAAYLVKMEQDLMLQAFQHVLVVGLEDPDFEPVDELEPVDMLGLLAERLTVTRESLRRDISRKRKQNPARRATALHRVVRREMQLAHQHASHADLVDYTATALTWRLGDLLRPELLSEEHRNLARHGVREPMSPIGEGVYPLPSERLIVAASVTLAEAQHYRPFAEARMEENPALGGRDFGLLWVLTWIITYERVKTQAGAIDQPLPPAQLERARAMLASAGGRPARATSSAHPC